MVLRTGEIHAWWASVEQPSSRFQTLAQTLSLEEQERAGRYHFDKDKKHFVVRRGILRTILGDYLGVRPDRLQFCYGAKGKPALPDAASISKIHFNLSHSGGLILYAFTRGPEIGVDIENIRDLADMEQIAELFFSKREKADFCALPQEKRNAGFFNCWTRKEAFIKAVGQGLFYPLDAFDVSLIPGEEPKLIKIKNQSAELDWTMKELLPAPGYIAAVAVAAKGLQSHLFIG